MSLQTLQPPLRAFLALVLALPEPDSDDEVGRWADDGGFHPGEPAEDSE